MTSQRWTVCRILVAYWTPEGTWVKRPRWVACATPLDQDPDPTRSIVGTFTKFASAYKFADQMARQETK